MKSWRSIQLKDQLCKQDELILSLFENLTVKYVGNDKEFESKLSISPESPHLIIVIDRPLWASDIKELIKNNVSDQVETFYIGINRYCVLGNDTRHELILTGEHGIDLLNFVSLLLGPKYTITKKGTFDNDQGKYHNFVQPLTWIYGTRTTNKDH